MSCDEKPAGGDCGGLTTERLRYFTGRHMTARDFEDEQAYHRAFRHLHNRMLHGWGIVCGLDVHHHPKAACRTQRVLVRCGMAIDCCGREILLRRDLTSEPIPWTQRPHDSAGTPDRDTVLILCLEYCETATERVPVLYNQDACSCPSMDYGRTREGVRLTWHWVRREDLGKHGWRTADDCAPDEDDTHHTGEDTPCPEPTCCLDPECPESPCIPLALLTESGEPGAEPVIDLGGRRRIGESRTGLTHICWTSWPHGGVVSAGQLAGRKRLEVRFDHPLEHVVQPAGGCGSRGVNACTFTVAFGEIYEDLDFVPYRTAPYLAEDRRTAVFELEDPRPSPAGGFRYLIGHTVHVTIRCDFLLDCEGHAVDGNHIGGRLPTGDGTAGGTFESWFTVVSDEDYERIKNPGSHTRIT